MVRQKYDVFTSNVMDKKCFTLETGLIFFPSEKKNQQKEGQ